MQLKGKSECQRRWRQTWPLFQSVQGPTFLQQRIDKGGANSMPIQMSDQPQTVVPQVPTMRSAEFKQIYANGFGLRLSSVDCSITFLLNSNLPGSNALVLFEQGSVS